MEVSEGTATPTIYGRSLTLKGLVESYETLKSQIQESGGEEADDLDDLYSAAKSLMAGKLDRALTLKKRLEEHNEACEKQIDFNKWTIEQIDNMVEEAVLATSDKRIDGLAYHAKIKKNPPSVNIEDEGAVPEDYKNWEFSMSDKFSSKETDLFFKYTSFVLGRAVTSQDQITAVDAETLKEYFDKTIDKRKLSADLKKAAVPGASLKQTEKVDIKEGRAVLGERK